MTIENCDKSFIKALKVLEDRIYLVNVNQNNANLIQLDINGVQLSSNILDIPNIAEIKFEISKELIVFFYQLLGQSQWGMRIYTQIMVIIYIKEDVLMEIKDLSIAVSEVAITLSWSEVNEQEIFYQTIDKMGTIIKSGSIKNDQQNSKPMLIVLLNIYVGFVWEVQNIQELRGLQLSIMNNLGEFSRQMQIICSPNCLQCENNQLCTICELGYNLIQIKQNENLCSKKCDQNCINCDNLGRCYQCVENYYLSNYQCKFDEIQSKSIRINQYSQQSQIQQQGAKFSDGSIIVVWSSNYQDGDRWGVYAQLIDNAGVKIGDNIKISLNSQGAQHSPHAAVLQDDTVIIIYIDGDPFNGNAILKAQKFDKLMQRIGDEFQVAQIYNNLYSLEHENTCKVLNLKNGGFVIGYLNAIQNTFGKFIHLKFYDQQGNFVVEQQIEASYDPNFFDYLNIATADNLAVSYKNGYWDIHINLYSLTGQFLQKKLLDQFSQQPLGYYYSLRSTPNYYALVYQKYDKEITKIFVQLYDLQLNNKGTPLEIQSSDYWISSFQYNDEILILIQNQYSQQLFQIKNEQIVFLNTYNLQLQKFNYYSSSIYIIESQNYNYFLIWQKNGDLYFQLSSSQGALLAQQQKVCSNGCLQCQNEFQCDICLSENYYLSNDLCLPINLSNCKKTTIPLYCDECQKGFYKKQEGICTQVPSNYQEPQNLLTLQEQEKIKDLILSSNGYIVSFSLTSSNVYKFKILDGEMNIYNIELNNQELLDSIKLQVYFEDNDTILVQYFEEQITVKRYSLNGTPQNPRSLLIQKYENYQLKSKNLILEPLSNYQYSLTFYTITENDLKNNLISFYNVILDSSFNEIGNIQNIFFSFDFYFVQQTTKSQFQVHLSNGRIYNIIRNKITGFFIFQDTLRPTLIHIAQIKSGNKVEIVEVKSLLSETETSISVGYKIQDIKIDFLISAKKVLNQGFSKQRFIKLLTYTNSFAIFVEQQNFNINSNQRQLVVQYIYNTGKNIGDYIYICSYEENAFMEIIQFQNGFKIYWQKQECDDQGCSNNLVWNTYDRDNDLPDPSEPQIIINDPIKDGKGIEVAEKCTQEMMKKLIKFSNNDYAILYICQNIMRMRKFDKEGLQLNFIEVTLELIHLFDTTVINNEIYVSMVDTLDKRICKIYKLDQFTNTLIFQQDYIHDSQIFDIKMEGLQIYYVLLISSFKNYIFDNASLIGRSQSLFIYDASNVKIFEKIDINYPELMTIENCDKSFIKALKVLEDRIYLVNVNQNNANLIQLDINGVQLSSNILDIPNIAEIKFEISKEFIVFIYQIYGFKEWGLRLCLQPFQCIYFDYQYLYGVEDATIAIYQSTFILSCVNKIQNSLTYYLFNQYGFKIMKGIIQIRSSISRPILFTLSNYYVGLSWAVKDNSSQWRLQLTIINDQGQFTESLTKICSSNCLECTSNSECTKCEIGFQLYYDGFLSGMYCKQGSSSACLSYDGDLCSECLSYYIPSGSQCILDEFQQYSLIVNEFTYFSQTRHFSAGFSDGCMLVIWNSNYQDGSGWGVYGQIVDGQRQKIGQNFRISQNIEGNQHSPYATILEDDTAIILFIDGDPVQGASLKIARFTKEQQRIGNELEIDTLLFRNYNLNYNCIAKIISLKNGGYLIAYLTNTDSQFLNLMKLKFYNQAGALVNLQQITGSFTQIIQIASTELNIGAIYIDKYNIRQAITYTFEGDIILNQEFTLINNLPLYQEFYLGNTAQYFVVAFVVNEENILSTKLQFFDSNFFVYGNQIQIQENLQINPKFFINVPYIQFDKYKYGISMIIEYIVNGRISVQEQYYVNTNWELNLINTYHIQKNWFMLNYQNVRIVESLDHSFFVVWTKFEHYNNVDSSNIHIQKMSAQGQYVTQSTVFCHQNCLTCINDQQCTQCIENYELVDGKCQVICESNCQSCIIPQICDLCMQGYYQQIEGKCTQIFPGYHQPQPLVNENFQGEISNLITFNDGTVSFITYYYSRSDNLYYWDFYLIKEQQVLMKKKIQMLATKQIRMPTYIYRIEQDYVVIYYELQRIEVVRIKEDQSIVLNKVIDQNEFILDVPSYEKQFLLEPLINNQYSLTYYINNYQENPRVSVYNIILDSELNQIGEVRLVLSSNEFEGRGREGNYLTFSSQNGIAQFKEEQMLQNQCLYSSLLLTYSCKMYLLNNGNYVQIYVTLNRDRISYTDSQWNTEGQSVYYRLLNGQFIPITEEMKTIQNGFLRQDFLECLSFSDTFAIIIKQFNYYTSMNQLVIQYFENSGAKLGNPVYVGFFNNDRLYLKVIQIETKVRIIWQEQVCQNNECQNNLLYKEYDDQGNEMTSAQNINCISNCDECINQNYCTKCSSNYLLDSNQQCYLECSQNCIKCSVISQCEICQNGYELVNNECQQLTCPNNCDLCSKNNEVIICDKCKTNYYSNQQQCLPECPSTCRTCDIPLVCSSCLQGFILTQDQKCQFEDPTIIDQVKNTSVSNPLRYTFTDGSYVLVWYQNGEQAGVYFQLYSIDNNKIGNEILVSDLTRRRLAESSIKKQYYANLGAINNNFYIIWADSTSDQTNYLIQGFNQNGLEIVVPQSIGQSDNNLLSRLTQPCQLLPLKNENIFAYYMTQNTEDLSNVSINYQVFDPKLNSISQIQKIPKVSYLTAPSIVQDDQGTIYISYSSDGYIFVQQITQFGDPINQPKAISDDGTLTLKTTILKNTMIVFLWENKEIQTFKAVFNLNYQLISKDLQTKSEVKVIGTPQVQQQTPDIKSFNDGFVVVWRITDSLYQSIGIQFQIFDGFGSSLTSITNVALSGKSPQNPNIQIINDDQFAITYISKGIDVDGSILGDSIQIKYYNKQGQEYFITTSQLCGKECNICQSPLNCYRCSYGYYLSLDNQCMIDCGLYCNLCEVPFVCQSCVNGYKLNSNNSCMQAECPDGYQRNQKTKLCDPQCSQECICTKPNICDSCISGYYLKDNECLLVLDLLNQDSINNSFYFYAFIALCIILVINWFACSICCYYCRSTNFVFQSSGHYKIQDQFKVQSGIRETERYKQILMQQQTDNQFDEIQQKSQNQNIYGQISQNQEEENANEIKFYVLNPDDQTYKSNNQIENLDKNAQSISQLRRIDDDGIQQNDQIEQHQNELSEEIYQQRHSSNNVEKIVSHDDSIEEIQHLSENYLNKEEEEEKKRKNDDELCSNQQSNKHGIENNQNQQINNELEINFDVQQFQKVEIEDKSSLYQNDFDQIDDSVNVQNKQNEDISFNLDIGLNWNQEEN
ncbi:unnamed protein product [Paramecium sonneborni]|uniref:EGF-like domain-containing protein n=1 Tax=Paramecium sonneborni TaxID=65129 RepID=A0A8S1R1J1_9CILI|nr:unnamed protein product [Paramecium sonneborni]